jgi:hypothetical protein
MTKEELDYVVTMAERHGRALSQADIQSDKFAAMVDGVREEADAKVAAVRAEAQSGREWCEEVEADNVELRTKVMRLNEALAQKERAIIALEATISAMTATLAAESVPVVPEPDVAEATEGLPEGWREVVPGEAWVRGSGAVAVMGNGSGGTWPFDLIVNGNRRSFYEISADAIQYADKFYPVADYP